MRFKRNMLLLYAVTDRKNESVEALYTKIEDALRGGATMVQLREKELSEDEFVMEAIKVKTLCHSYGVPLIINDSVKTALLSGADGVHVGLEDTPVAEIRKIAGKNIIIGATAKTVEQARNAEKSGADYVGVGAVFPSPTKKNAVQINPEKFKEICSSIHIPAAAIGGIGLDNIEELRGCGAAGIAVVSSLFSAADIKKAASLLKKAAEDIISD